ncbi:mucin-3B isoform X1 [Gadus chalcogrammus]|uniref:mucin-3B isoform X1 n=2 Tax=Gadus chalcogrammus TaxID=1042646 RepID=UPI0024C4B81F|nr:mucin-3B isoform X1 [Gadus chalcogrammus]
MSTVQTTDNTNTRSTILPTTLSHKTNQISTSSTTHIPTPVLNTSTSTFHPFTETTHKVITNSTISFSPSTTNDTPFSTPENNTTTPDCAAGDCQCSGSPCGFNPALGQCQCHCADYTYGDTCFLGQNVSAVFIDDEALPKRKANFSLTIGATFEEDFNDINSPQSQRFIHTLTTKLEPLCKMADAHQFKQVRIVKLKAGSVIAEIIVEYNYPNNESHIQFLNSEIDDELMEIFDPLALNTIGQAFGNVTIELNGLLLQPTVIRNATDLEPYVKCQYANYTAKLNNGRWECVGACKRIPGYCHQHGECLNHIKEGPICRCQSSALQQYYGPRCESFRWGAGFYGALFGSLAAVLLLLVTIVGILWFKKRRCDSWYI